MRKHQTVLLLACLCMVFVGVLGGCSPFNGVVDNASERNERVILSTDLQLRMVLDDADRLMLLDRSSRLMPWYGRVE
ncbi:MAG: hypothetical protein NTV86_21810 [Planctomycetota bacterium]|nr:hypothetical protein [Planctomycetota bacterium]